MIDDTVDFNSSAIEIARTGSEVLIVGNLATASLVNPEREAQHWAETQIARLKKARSSEAVVVLGVGSAFHLRALTAIADGRPIIAVDTCRESIEFAKSRTPNVTFVWAHAPIQTAAVQAAYSFLSRPEIASWLRQPFTFLKHKPTVSRAGEPLRRIESWITGRTPEALAAHLRMRPEIAAALDPARASRIAEIPLVSIRDLAKMWDVSAELKSDRRIFRVLEELVR